MLRPFRWIVGTPFRDVVKYIPTPSSLLCFSTAAACVMFRTASRLIALSSPKVERGKLLNYRRMDEHQARGQCPHCGSALERSGQPTGGTDRLRQEPTA